MWHSAFNWSIGKTIGTTRNSYREAAARHAGMSCGEWGQSVAYINRHISDKHVSNVRRKNIDFRFVQQPDLSDSLDPGSPNKKQRARQANNFEV